MPTCWNILLYDRYILFIYFISNKYLCLIFATVTHAAINRLTGAQLPTWASVSGWADWYTAPHVSISVLRISINAQEQHLKILEFLSYSSIRNHPLRKFLNKAFLSAKTLDPKKYFNKWRLQRSIIFPHKSWLSWDYFLSHLWFLYWSGILPESNTNPPWIHSYF